MTPRSLGNSLMYMHLGLGVIVREEDVVGIFDLENTTACEATRAFLRRAQEEERVEEVCYDLPRSFVVCSGGPMERVYLAQAAPSTLLRRSRADISGHGPHVTHRKRPD